VTGSTVALARAAAATAALVLAVLSRGDAVVLAGLLAVAAWRVPALVLLPATVAATWRFGSTSLEALAGAQSVLGPAGLVDPVRAAAASWCAATSVVLSVSTLRGGAGDRRVDVTSVVVVAASGAAAAALVAGPSLGGEWWWRVLAAVAASGVAVLVRRLRPRVDRFIDVAAVVAGLLPVPLLVGVAPGWSGTLDTSALRSGLLLAVATAVLVAAAARTLATHREHRTA
jgi:hypothetical protein